MINALPNDIVGLIVSFLERPDDKGLIAAARVCRSWRDHPVLAEARHYAAPRIQMHQELSTRLDYPYEMAHIVLHHYMPIERLPELPLGDRYSDYIDFIQPTEMAHPVMRFKDRYGRPGIAIKIHVNRGLCLRERWRRFRDLAIETGDLSRLARVAINIAYRFFRGDGPEGVLTIFRRYSDPNSLWVHAWDEHTIERLIITRHLQTNHIGEILIEACPNCPFIGQRINPSTLIRLLNGQDPDFSLPQ